MKKRALILASGTADGGGSGCLGLVEAAETGLLDVDIVGIISNFENGGVAQIAKMNHKPFWHFARVFRLNYEDTASMYRSFATKFRPDIIILAGWNSVIPYNTLDPKITINIHPGLLPDFGGPKMFGDNVHQAAITAHHESKTRITAASIHFVTEEIDGGPIIFQYPVVIRLEDTVDSLRTRVQEIEHAFYPWIVNMVVSRKIYWDGRNPESLVLPSWYTFHKLSANIR